MPASGKDRQTSIQLFILIVALALLLPDVARADEAYVCEGGRVVYVPFGKLEAMQRKDDCLAAHYARGRRHAAPVPAGSVAAPATAVATALAALAPTVPPLPVRRPHAASASPEVVVHHEPPPAAVATELVAPRVEAVTFRHRLRAAAAPVAETTQPIDFRRVPIINARPGDPQVFHHTR